MRLSESVPWNIITNRRASKFFVFFLLRRRVRICANFIPRLRNFYKIFVRLIAIFFTHCAFLRFQPRGFKFCIYLLIKLLTTNPVSFCMGGVWYLNLQTYPILKFGNCVLRCYNRSRNPKNRPDVNPKGICVFLGRIFEKALKNVFSGKSSRVG